MSRNKSLVKDVRGLYIENYIENEKKIKKSIENAAFQHFHGLKGLIMETHQ